MNYTYLHIMYLNMSLKTVLNIKTEPEILVFCLEFFLCEITITIIHYYYYNITLEGQKYGE